MSEDSNWPLVQQTLPGLSIDRWSLSSHDEPKWVASHIVAINIKRLFGQYSYDIKSEALDKGSAPILYGENGVGKTNILKIVFHMLSPAGNKGHRTALSNIKFEEAKVTLSNGIQVVARRNPKNLSGNIAYSVTMSGASSRRLLAAWEHSSGEEKVSDTDINIRIDPDAFDQINRNRSPKEKSRAMQMYLLQMMEKKADPLQGHDAFCKALRENVPPIYFLNADRIFAADNIDAKSEYEISEPGQRATPEAMVTVGRQRALNLAVQRASRSLSRLGVIAARRGSLSTHGIYEGILRSLADRTPANADVDAKALGQELSTLAERFELFSTYGLAPQLQAKKMLDSLEHLQEADFGVANEVLRPYFNGLRLQAADFEVAYAVIDTFITTVNQFLYDKRLTFSVETGLVVVNGSGEPLSPSDLSSGEQQLLLLFCHISLARERGGIFIVDEPEISLNVHWQRKIIGALDSLNLEKKLQFLLASHSMEILSRGGENVIVLDNIRYGD